MKTNTELCLHLFLVGIRQNAKTCKIHLSVCANATGEIPRVHDFQNIGNLNKIEDKKAIKKVTQILPENVCPTPKHMMFSEDVF